MNSRSIPLISITGQEGAWMDLKGTFIPQLLQAHFSQTTAVADASRLLQEICVASAASFSYGPVPNGPALQPPWVILPSVALLIQIREVSLPCP